MCHTTTMYGPVDLQFNALLLLRPGSFTPAGRVPASHHIRSWVGPYSRHGRFGEGNNLCPRRKLNPQFFRARSLINISTEPMTVTGDGK
jgi:hypothetical protein